MQELLWELRELLEAEHDTKSFNVGVNVGAAAGQTVDHAHVHLIPRYEGDVPDPRGGVRWVIPERAPYWRVRHHACPALPPLGSQEPKFAGRRPETAPLLESPPDGG